jgi:predicted component of type VI protein secretion system
MFPGPVATHRVDRDVVDDLMAAFAPVVRLADGSELRFSSLDQLHPDELMGRVARVGAILDGRDAGPRSDPASEAAPESRPSPPASDAGLLDQILGGVVGDAPAPATRPTAGAPIGSIRAFAAEAAKFDTVAEPSARAKAEAATREERAAEALREVLRDAPFRAMERRWRGVEFLVRRLETGPDLHVHLADLSRDAIRAEVDGAGGLEGSALRGLLQAGAGPEKNPWSLVVMMDGSFGPGSDDQLLLAWITGLCDAFGAKVLVDGEPGLAGIPTLDDFDDRLEWHAPDAGWEAFRAQPEAGSLGVCLPGFLLRDPYGPGSDPVDGLPLAEVSGRPSRDDYVWGGAAVACAVVVAREAVGEGGGLPDTTIAGLPLHSWRDGVDSGTVCGAAAMTDEAAKRLLASGITPAAWMRAADSVRLLLPRTVTGAALLG